jgi:hypothetical protein
MAKDTEPLETLNANAEQAVKQAGQIVEKTIDQTRGALDNYFSFMQNAFSFYPVGGTAIFPLPVHSSAAREPQGYSHQTRRLCVAWRGTGLRCDRRCDCQSFEKAADEAPRVGATYQ